MLNLLYAELGEIQEMNEIHTYPIEEYQEFITYHLEEEKGNIGRVIHPVDYSASNRATNMESLADTNSYRGIAAYYIDHDPNMARQWFYLSAKLRAEACRCSVKTGGISALNNFIFALLSDNQEIVKIYSDLDVLDILNNDFYPSFEQMPSLEALYASPKEKGFHVLLLQHLLKSDWATIENMWNTYQEKIKKKTTYYLDRFSFYFALRDGDVVTMRKIIEKYLLPRAHKSLNKDLIYEYNGEFWSHRPTMYSKLAAMFGYELDIKSDLIPADLIPVRPLEHYDDYYEFFAPDFDWEAGLRKPRTLLDILLGRNKRT